MINPERQLAVDTLDELSGLPINSTEITSAHLDERRLNEGIAAVEQAATEVETQRNIAALARVASILPAATTSPFGTQLELNDEVTAKSASDSIVWTEYDGSIHPFWIVGKKPEHDTRTSLLLLAAGVRSPYEMYKKRDDAAKLRKIVVPTKLWKLIEQDQNASNFFEAGMLAALEVSGKFVLSSTCPQATSLYTNPLNHKFNNQLTYRRRKKPVEIKKNITVDQKIGQLTDDDTQIFDIYSHLNRLALRLKRVPQLRRLYLGW